jgi:hypothetical protein
LEEFEELENKEIIKNVDVVYSIFGVVLLFIIQFISVCIEKYSLFSPIPWGVILTK